MLDYLRIRDLALIADMELEFSKGMNVLTGETGAGKSFVLKAISFLMGDKMGAEMVRPNKEKAHVEALFNLPDGDMIIRRELIAETGRSRFFINGSLGSQEMIRELRPRLILHTSQHGQQRLLQPAYQAEVLDGWMNKPELLLARDACLKDLHEVENRLKSLQERVARLTDRRELLEMHKAAIDKVDPQPDEDDTLEAARQELRVFEQSRKWHERLLRLIHANEEGSLKDLLTQLDQAVSQLAVDDTAFTEHIEEIAQFRILLQDLARKVKSATGVKPAHNAEDIESRLFALSQLKRKLNRNLPEILALRDEIEESVSFLDACGLDIKQANKDYALAQEKLAAALQTLNQARHEAAGVFCNALEKELANLGFSEHVRVMVDFSPHEYAPGCVEDRCRFVWAPNPGQSPQALDRIASGGELSRFLLAIISLQAQNEGATLIFDEVDAGIGGVTLNRVADCLAELAAKRQMLLITHWPQLATRAKEHFQVSKEVVSGETFTRCVRLDGVSKAEELARMAGIES